MALDELSVAEARRAHLAAGLDVPPAAVTVSPEELEAAAGFAAKHDEENPSAKPMEALKLHRATGRVVGVVPNFEREEWQRQPFLEADVAAAGAAARGTWIRQRGASRERRPQASAKARGRRAGPSSRRSDDPPPLTRIRGFSVASARMVVHLDRRRAARAAA